MEKTALITGATAGFGKAIALRFASEGYRVIITGRRSDRLDDLKQEITERFNTACLTLNFDVRDRQKTLEVLNDLPTA